MKAVLEFMLPEEAEFHKLAVEGPRWQAAMWALDMRLRNAAKHEDKKSISIADARAWLREEIEGLDLRLE